jgi:NAD(P)-dependent dehydrogenase (short-subunit alcohol dehydrogenase family)
MLLDTSELGRVVVEAVARDGTCLVDVTDRDTDHAWRHVVSVVDGNCRYQDRERGVAVDVGSYVLPDEVDFLVHDVRLGASR